MTRNSRGGTGLNKKKALVTGGASFIGSNLCQELAERGKHVIILDDLSTGKKGKCPKLWDGKARAYQVKQIRDIILRYKLHQEVNDV